MPALTFLDIIGALSQAKDALQAWLLPVSTVFFLLYPLVLLLWTAMEGRAAARKVGSGGSMNGSVSVGNVGGHVICEGKSKPIMKLKQQQQQQQLPESLRKPVASLCLLLFASMLCAVSGGAVAAFAVSRRTGGHDEQHTGLQACNTEETQAGQLTMPSTLPMPHPQCPPKGESQRTTSHTFPSGGEPVLMGAALGLLGGLGLAGGASLFAGRRTHQTQKWSSRGSLYPACRAKAANFDSNGVFTATASTASDEGGAAWLDGVPAGRCTNISLWHNVSLYEKTWLDEMTGLFHFVNEIPHGGLQKWEVQTKVPFNSIAEHAKGSKKLQEFGWGVPFNYGCFPQTFRDPDQLCEVYGAPGDNDPLDVIELSEEPLDVGTVVRCRPLGAICLIDEGRADWKILVVNADAQSPMASARSMEDVERLMPGRLKVVTTWLREFKAMSAKEGSTTTLHMEVHSPERAKALIEADHSSWTKLKKGADADGFANGHWIGEPDAVKPVKSTYVLNPRGKRATSTSTSTTQSDEHLPCPVGVFSNASSSSSYP